MGATSRVFLQRFQQAAPAALAVHSLRRSVAHAGLRLGLAPRRVRVMARARLAEVARHAAHVPHVVRVRVAFAHSSPLAAVRRLVLARVPLGMRGSGAPPAAMAREFAALQHKVRVRLALASLGPSLAGLVSVGQLEARAGVGRTQQLRLSPPRRLVQRRGCPLNACIEAPPVG